MNFEEMSTPYRCAVYFAPAPLSAWWQAGSHWLGRCAASGASYALPDIEDIDPGQLRNLTADPRRYGWHATLKAPFQLASGKKIEDLVARMQDLALKLPAFTMPPLQVSTQENFLALRPHGDLQNINTTAAACVRELHDMGMPLSLSELARRRQVPLTPEQDQLLQTWGYPWVFEHFKFHFSLTGSLESATSQERAALIQAAKARFDSLEACRFDHIALFVEHRKGADFQLTQLLELKG